MATSTTIFVLLGVSFVAGSLTKVLLWLDTPQRGRRAKYARG